MVDMLRNKVALVTGGSSGIGRSSALTFAREGAKVIVSNDSDIKGGEETVNLIRKAGGEASFIKADVSNIADVEALINKIITLYGKLDCAHNNAGIDGTPTLSVTEYDKKTWDRLLDINLTGVWLSMRYEIIQMLKQGGGTIVNTSSVWGIIGTSGGWGFSAYVATKHGVAGLTKAAALEYAKMGIRVNAVCPGPILTPMMERAIASDPSGEVERHLISRVPLGRIGTPQEVAEAVVWLCSDAASFVTGHMLAVDGGEVIN